LTQRLALIPARGGSKGLPGKNLAVVGGMTLLARAVRCAHEASVFDKVVVTTDDPAIAEEGIKSGAEVPFLRPKELASDAAPVLAAIKHALQHLESTGSSRFDLVALLEPTSPLRTPEIVRAVVNAAEQVGVDAALTVTPVPARYHPLKQFVADAEGRALYYLPAGTGVVNRQELSQTYTRNGMCYAVRRSSLDAGYGVLGSAAAMVIVAEPVVNIDDANDLELARRLIESTSKK
jgi:CMP-N,N'-diacetyllegionaminic acid synthase